MASNSKSSQLTLTKNNQKRINALAKSNKLNPNTLSVIANQLRLLEKNKYDALRKYSQGYDYFYQHYGQVMRALERHVWNQVVGPGGFIYAKDLPNGIPYGANGFREGVVWKKLSRTFAKFPIPNKVKDDAILGKFPNSSNGLVLQEMLLHSHRMRLNNDYDKMEGFVDALLDEIEAEIKARRKSRNS